MSVTDPIPGRLYRLTFRGDFFVPIHQVGTDTLRGVAWRCLTQEGPATLWLWAGSYDLVEEA
jgi:hypothetical protein